MKTTSHIPRKVLQLHRHRRQVSGVRSSCSDTLPGWGLTRGAISIDSTASTSTPWCFVSSSPMDYGFLAVTSWYNLSHVLQYNDLVSCLTWLRSIWCNRCCVCWDPINSGIVIRLFIMVSYYCLFKILHALWYLWLPWSSSYLYLQEGVFMLDSGFSLHLIWGSDSNL